MKIKTWILWGTVVLLSLGFLGIRAAGGGGNDDTDKLLLELPKSRLTLADGIRQACAKDPEAALSARFEVNDKGELMLSVYTAMGGLGTDAEHNVLREQIGSPEEETWDPTPVIFTDVEHVARAATHQTLMTVTRCTLLDIVRKAEQDTPGFIYSVTPVVEDHKASFIVLAADKGRRVELRYDLATGGLILPRG